MRYDSEVRYKKSYTDRVTDLMDIFGELVNQFFFLNTNLSSKRINNILTRLREFSTIDFMLPNLIFDAEYKKILNSDAINQIFHAVTPLGELRPKRSKDYKFLLNEEQYHEFHENKYSNEEKVKRCRKRADFCLNLLENENFSTILESLIKQENVMDQIKLISELRRHLTYHQVVCCFSQLRQETYPEISYLKLVNLIHVLFRSIDRNKVPNINKKPTSLMFVTDGKNDQVSSSLTSN